MKKGTGILLEPSTGDLLVKIKRDVQGKITGGLVVGGSIHQNQTLILEAHEGEFKERPDMGVGIAASLLDNDVTGLKRRIAEHLKKDGQEVRKVSISKDFNITIDASYS